MVNDLDDHGLETLVNVPILIITGGEINTILQQISGQCTLYITLSYSRTITR